ncbi:MULTISPECIES: phage portal protein family protein [unclassified Psychrobacter]|uniref:phage portal protein family protein n=1 Tax=unclassified Psychrobacter TaxID=196806 RepID=UPI003FD3CD4E
MFGIKPKKQKVDQKTLYVAFDSALESSDAVSADVLLQETGKTRQELLDAVMADDEVISCREDIEGAISAAAWRIWGDDVNEDTVNRLYRIIRRLHNDFASLAVLAKFNGYAVAEYVFKKEPDGFLTLHSLLSKDGELDNYTPMRDGSMQLKTEDDNIEINQTIKYLVLTSKAVPARPAGELMIVRAYPAVALRRREWAYAGQFIARYSQPYVVGMQGSDSGFGTTLGDFTSKIFSFINGGAAGIGKDDKIEMHQLSGDGSAFELFERLANRRIQKLLLGRVKTSELTAGSRSAQETDDEARQDRVMSYLGLMTRGIQHAIDAIIAVNQAWGVPINAPQGIWFEYPVVKKFNKDEAEIDAKYVSTGQVRLTKQRLLNVGYEESEFEIIDSTAPAPTPVPSTQQILDQLSLQYKLSQNLPTIITDPATDDDIEQERGLMEPKMAALLALSQKCDSYDELKLGLAKLDLPDEGLVAALADKLVNSFTDGLGINKDDKDA